ncbi:hypothetical protein EVG20_g6101 [Dentipellis fragilis]|uniref:Cytochrome P450 n=1 Tax=Dentipellis fragilis TaxID=205917 RepID=A0A4Y9YNL6_9AGAM|nr:hypothetical protein EVG20_g6101 [Dentipellis fragilis]
MTVLLSSVRDALKNVDPVAIVCVAIAAFSYLYFSRATTFRKPPGPHAMPLISEICSRCPLAASGFSSQSGTRGYKQYGPIFYLNILGTNVFVVNTHQVAKQVLEKNSNSYAHRPLDMVMASELIGWDRAVALKAGGAKHRHYRKPLSKVLNSTAVRRFRPQQQRSAEALCAAILRTVDDFPKHIRASIGASIVDIAYGREVRVRGLRYIDFAEFVHERFSLTARSFAYPVDIVPACAQYKRDAEQWRADLDALAQVPFNSVKEDVASGAANPSYVDDHLSAEALTPHSRKRPKTRALTDLRVAHGVRAAHVPQSRRTEARPGGDRCDCRHGPGPDARGCTEPAVCERMYQGGPPILDGRAHRAAAPRTKDEVYGSYGIPAGASIASTLPRLRRAHLVHMHRLHRHREHLVHRPRLLFPGACHSRSRLRRGMMHDSAVYASPHTFEPARFLPPRAERDPIPTAFGFGRRICPGMHLAEAGVWLYAACMLAVFDIAPRTGVEVRCEAGEGIIRCFFCAHDEGHG